MSLVLQLPITMRLTPTERTIAMHVAKVRHANDRKAAVTDLRVRDEDPLGWKLDLEGFGAELAFARAANLYPDFTTEPRSGGVDARLPSGLTVDVKGTARLDGNLIAATSKDASGFGADICVLVTGSIPVADDGRQLANVHAEFTVVGWAWTSDLVDPKSVRMLRKPTYVIERRRLHTTLPLATRPAKDDYPSLYATFHDPGLDSILDL